MVLNIVFQSFVLFCFLVAFVLGPFTPFHLYFLPADILLTLPRAIQKNEICGDTQSKQILIERMIAKVISYLVKANKWIQRIFYTLDLEVAKRGIP